MEKAVRMFLDLDNWNVCISNNGRQWNCVLYGDTEENSKKITEAYEQIGFKKVCEW